MDSAFPPMPPYELRTPDRLTSGVVFASPHSGRDYPADFLKRSVLDERRLRSSEDAFVDRLLQAVPGQGATLLTARAPRAFVDLNRAEDELDPALIEGLRGAVRGPRVVAGLGVIPRVVAGGRAIYSGKLTQAEAEARLAGIWRPYHTVLSQLLNDCRARFGRAVLLDVHSMPSEALEGLGANRPDIVLGDRYGASAAPGVVASVEAAFAGTGLRLSRNTPFAGAYITQRYGRPAEGVHVVQVEINRALYMDEAQVRPNADFASFEALMRGVTARVIDLLHEPNRLAAE